MRKVEHTVTPEYTAAMRMKAATQLCCLFESNPVVAAQMAAHMGMPGEHERKQPWYATSLFPQPDHLHPFL